MSEAGFALQQAVHTCLAGDGALAALLGEGAVHDVAPRAAALPLVAVGEWSVVSLPAAGGPLHEHRFDLVVRSRAAGRREAQAIAARVEELLDGAALAPAGHRLVDLAARGRLTRLARDGRTIEASIAFRAVSEPL